MATDPLEPLLRGALEERRGRLQGALARGGAAPEIRQLLEDVDAALERLEGGRFGVCRTCGDAVEPDRLLADPLAQYCLDHLSPGEQRDLERDLAVAARVQQALLPPPSLARSGWEVEYHYQAAGLVSGDYCDLVLPEPEAAGFLFLVGDVAGKGIGASLLMSNLHATFRSLAALGTDVRALMEQANSLFCASILPAHYATLICGRAFSDGTVELANAGHPPALMAGPSGVRRLPSTGLPLGLFCHSEYPAERLRLEPGEILLLCTDGVLESRDPGEAEFGIDRLVAWLGAEHARSTGALVSGLRDHLAAFRGGAAPPDDVTFLALRRR